MRKVLAVLAGTAAIVVGLSACGNPPSTRSAENRTAGSGGTHRWGRRIRSWRASGSTLDVIDGELAQTARPDQALQEQMMTAAVAGWSSSWRTRRRSPR